MATLATTQKNSPKQIKKIKMVELEGRKWVGCTRQSKQGKARKGKASVREVKLAFLLGREVSIFVFFWVSRKPTRQASKAKQSKAKGEGSWQCRLVFLSVAVATGKKILTLVSSCWKRRRTTTIVTKKPECELVFGKWIFKSAAELFLQSLALLFSYCCCCCCCCEACCVCVCVELGSGLVWFGCQFL